jgi:SAM-dependent methyltransferase
MHASSYQLMGRFLETIGPDDKVLDVGSYAVQGQTYRDLVRPGNYTGLDVTEGPNVDIVVKDPYSWAEIPVWTYDVVISGQALEHVEFPWLTVQEMNRALKPGGRVCIIAPSAGKEHRYPLDCYRYYPDGLAALAKWAGWRVDEVRRYPELNKQWQDCILIATKE